MADGASTQSARSAAPPRSFPPDQMIIVTVSPKTVWRGLDTGIKSRVTLRTNFELALSNVSSSPISTMKLA